MSKLNNTNRRTFIKHAAIAGVALPGVMPTLVRAASPNGKLNLGAIAVGGKGWTDVTSATPGHNLVAFCDVMTGATKRKGGFAAAAEQWPKARRYSDWRRLLDESKDIDGLTISTPDHMHAAPTLAAMRLGKHVYTQKPLTHTIQEARLVRDEARRLGVKTQMGIQNQSKIGHRMTAELVQSGVIGKVLEVHSWSHKEWAGPAEGRGSKVDAVPKGLDWDLWLGNAPVRPFNEKLYTPMHWRGWIDFGSGTLGDMGIHIYEPLHTCLEVGPAKTITSRGKAPNPETWQPRNTIEYTFDGTKFTKYDTLKFTWYDGRGNQPNRNIAKGMPDSFTLPQQGTLFVGELGSIVHAHTGGPSVFPREVLSSFTPPKLEARNHYQNWQSAIIDGGQSCAAFDFSAQLTETVLLGNIAVRFPNKTLEWNSDAMKFNNSKKASKFVKQDYRKGWEVEGLG